MNEAYKYVEIIAKTINHNPELHSDKISTVYHLANRLKIYDTDYFNFEETTVYQEPLFLIDLTKNYRHLYSKNISHLLNQEDETPQPAQSEPKLEQQSFVETQNQYQQQEYQQPAYDNTDYSQYQQQQQPNFYPQVVQEEQSVQQPAQVDPNVYTDNNYYNPQ